MILLLSVLFPLWAVFLSEKWLTLGLLLHTASNIIRWEFSSIISLSHDVFLV